MRATGKSRSKESRYNATIGFLIAIGMLTVALMKFNWAKADTGGRIFMVIWMLGVCAAAFQSFRNAFTREGLHHLETDYDLRIDGLGSSNYAGTRVDERLRELESLVGEGLISEQEYHEKRKAVLDDQYGG